MDRGTLFMKKMLYRFAEALVFKKGLTRIVDGQKIRFPVKYFRYYPKKFEPETTDFVLKNCKYGDTVIDIGAHMGLYTVLMARKVGIQGRVYSFEPSPSNKKIVEQLVSINGVLENVEIYENAVGEKNKKTAFYVFEHEASFSNSLIDYKSETPKKKISIDVICLDDFVQKKNITQINCIKMDAEGAELDILIGAEKIIKKCKPKIRLSVHPPIFVQSGKTIEELWDVIVKYNYSVEFQGKRVDRDWFLCQRDLFEVVLL